MYPCFDIGSGKCSFIFYPWIISETNINIFNIKEKIIDLNLNVKENQNIKNK